MISYGQNQEDVVLFRLLEHVPFGRFVDVGAGHPVLDNVTYALYERGWRGVNVEPMRREVAMLREVRPEDETLAVALGSEPGEVTLFEAPLDNRGATTSNAALAERYRAAGQQFHPFSAEVRTLASILDRFEPGSVHVVKIDVEGMESAVVAGADLPRTQPWVLVIEATVPNSTVSTAGEWEADVLAGGYTLALFDGLNRFYVRDDLPDVATLLSVPANVFDDWMPYELHLCKEHARRSAEYAQALERERDRAAPHIAELQRRAARERVLDAELSMALERAARLERESQLLRALVDTKRPDR